MNTTQKAKNTRERNQAARAALCQEQAGAVKAARLALQRVFENKEATSAEILRAAELLTELAGVRRC